MNEVEMPKYLCTKVVWALKIKRITLSGKGGILAISDKGFDPIEVSKEYISRHNPQVGGYYVIYKDGYKSFSPANAFEDGYQRIGLEKETSISS